MSSRNVVDYIIVGNGTAGSTLAHQLGANPANRVLVIEYGGSDPQRGAGRAMNGSTTVNGTNWNRGGETDYPAWETAALTHWIRSHFRSVCTAIGRQAVSATGSRGSDGRRLVEAAGPPDALSTLWIGALARQGVDAAEVLNRPYKQVGYAPLSMSNDTRTSAARAIRRGNARRPNVRVRKHCAVRRIVFDGTTATGVEAQTPRGTVWFTARQEVIVCAGTMGSPLLLERSGIGDPEVLTNAGVHLVVDNPAVGGNLRQRHGAVIALRLNGAPDRNRKPATPAARLWSTVKYVLRRSRMPAHGGTAVLTTLSSDRGTSNPDMELLFTPVSAPDRDRTSAGADHAIVAFYPQSPTSTRSVHITGPTLNDPPRLQPGHLSTDHDKDLTVAAFARVRDILATEPFAPATTETFPGPEVVDTADVLPYVLDHGVTASHQVGTCVLGPDGVVDDELRVHGTHRLRVADSSVLPTLMTGNTAALSMAVGWIAGDILRNANTRRR
ncbi:GMC family oxidoreductase [Streptomyces sp. NPDC056663]|uniref:GMC family oxidoreductase n=1 Tax=Streptomyces sp. NPDC056663 TaxID=3345899 RepID=UPI0036C9871B